MLKSNPILDVLNRGSRFAAIRIFKSRFESQGQKLFKSLLRLYYCSLLRSVSWECKNWPGPVYFWKTDLPFSRLITEALPKRRKVLEQHPFLWAKRALFKNPFQLDRVSFPTPEFQIARFDSLAIYFQVPEGHHPRSTTLREASRGNRLSEGFSGASAGVSSRVLRGLCGFCGGLGGPRDFLRVVTLSLSPCDPGELLEFRIASDPWFETRKSRHLRT